MGRTTLYRHWPDFPSLIYEAIAQRIANARPTRTGVLRDDLVGQQMWVVIERAGADPTFAELKRTANCPLTWTPSWPSTSSRAR
ncbi:hypothetical protein [Streptomyces xantholiticus]|uniref:TetR family transcriptional regulator n=1 Tax=Streptomyces xantholiticus TaxID=68285 RepID=A0ABV1V390_9ACTN